MKPILEVQNINVTLHKKEILKNISFQLFEHDVFMVIGPNGSGKTTMIKAVMNTMSHTGNVFLHGKNIKTLSRLNLAKKIGVLMQKHEAFFSYSVKDVVAMGRYPHTKGFFKALDETDHHAIQYALDITNTKDIAHRSIIHLSGGELQRVFLAQVIAQEPDILILDEPTNNLDLQFQIALFDIIKKWASKENHAVIAIVHDLNLVFSYGTNAMILKNGEVFSKGKVNDVLSRETLNAVYDVDIYTWMENLLRKWNLSQ